MFLSIKVSIVDVKKSIYRNVGITHKYLAIIAMLTVFSVLYYFREWVRYPPVLRMNVRPSILRFFGLEVFLFFERLC